MTEMLNKGMIRRILGTVIIGSLLIWAGTAGKCLGVDLGTEAEVLPGGTAAETEAQTEPETSNAAEISDVTEKKNSVSDDMSIPGETDMVTPTGVEPTKSNGTEEPAEAETSAGIEESSGSSITIDAQEKTDQEEQTAIEESADTGSNNGSDEPTGAETHSESEPTVSKEEKPGDMKSSGDVTGEESDMRVVLSKEKPVSNNHEMENTVSEIPEPSDSLFAEGGKKIVAQNQLKAAISEKIPEIAKRSMSQIDIHKKAIEPGKNDKEEKEPRSSIKKGETSPERSMDEDRQSKGVEAEIVNDAQVVTLIPGNSSTRLAPSVTKVSATAIAKDGRTVIRDSVEYSGLNKGEEYVMTGTLMDKETGKELLIDGQPVKTSTFFTASGESGSVRMDLPVDSDKIKGKSVVVFQKFYDRNGEVVMEVKDLDEDKQTVTVAGTKTLGTAKQDDLQKRDRTQSAVTAEKAVNSEKAGYGGPASLKAAEEPKEKGAFTRRIREMLPKMVQVLLLLSGVVMLILALKPSEGKERTGKSVISRLRILKEAG